MTEEQGVCLLLIMALQAMGIYSLNRNLSDINHNLEAIYAMLDIKDKFNKG